MTTSARPELDPQPRPRPVGRSSRPRRSLLVALDGLVAVAPLVYGLARGGRRVRWPTRARSPRRPARAPNPSCGLGGLVRSRVARAPRRRTWLGLFDHGAWFGVPERAIAFLGLAVLGVRHGAAVRSTGWRSALVGTALIGPRRHHGRPHRSWCRSSSGWDFPHRSGALLGLYVADMNVGSTDHAVDHGAARSTPSGGGGLRAARGLAALARPAASVYAPRRSRSPSSSRGLGVPARPAPGAPRRSSSARLRWGWLRCCSRFGAHVVRLLRAHRLLPESPRSTCAGSTPPAPASRRRSSWSWPWSGSLGDAADPPPTGEPAGPPSSRWSSADGVAVSGCCSHFPLRVAGVVRARSARPRVVGSRRLLCPSHPGGGPLAITRAENRRLERVRRGQARRRTFRANPPCRSVLGRQVHAETWTRKPTPSACARARCWSTPAVVALGSRSALRRPRRAHRPGDRRLLGPRGHGRLRTTSSRMCVPRS